MVSRADPGCQVSAAVGLAIFALALVGLARVAIMISRAMRRAARWRPRSKVERAIARRMETLHMTEARDRGGLL